MESERTNEVLAMEVTISYLSYGVLKSHVNSLTLPSTVVRPLFPTLTFRGGTDLREKICIRYVKWRSPN